MDNTARKHLEPDLAPEPLITIPVKLVKSIFDTIGMRQAESGGALGGVGNSYQISHYHFDKSSRNTGVTFSPDYVRLNRLFKNDWNPSGIRLLGFIHSHPGGMSRPSMGDEIYAERILKAIDDLDFLLLPIINPVPEIGRFRLTPWVAFLDERGQGVKIVKARIKVVAGAVEDEAADEIRAPFTNLLNRELDEITIPRLSLVSTTNNNESQATVLTRPSSTPEVDLEQTFNRVQLAYDLNIMRSSRIICVGAGGAASWIEELARAGLGQFVLIDPDEVSETNLATQQTYRCDIGRPKVDCLAERIQGINPTAKVIALKKLLDDLSDEEIESLAHEKIDGQVASRTIICGLTDNFYPQSRVNRLALQLGIPSLCAQLYLEGRGAELTFTYPGITKACHRCILSSRYDYYLKQKKENTVTSHGTPIFSTTRLNAIKGFLTLAILHNGSDHPRWGTMLKRIGNRNLIQVRMDPDFSKTVGISVFDKVLEKADQERILFDETVWLPQKPECPENGYDSCPDCGGTSFLGDAMRTFDNTKDIPLFPSSRIEINKSRRIIAASNHANRPNQEQEK